MKQVHILGGLLSTLGATDAAQVVQPLEIEFSYYRLDASLELHYTV